MPLTCFPGGLYTIDHKTTIDNLMMGYGAKFWGPLSTRPPFVAKAWTRLNVTFKTFTQRNEIEFCIELIITWDAFKPSHSKVVFNWWLNCPYLPTFDNKKFVPLAGVWGAALGVKGHCPCGGTGIHVHVCVYWTGNRTALPWPCHTAAVKG